jgi:hypothetical protein
MISLEIKMIKKDSKKIIGNIMISNILAKLRWSAVHVYVLSKKTNSDD